MSYVSASEFWLYFRIQRQTIAGLAVSNIIKHVLIKLHLWGSVLICHSIAEMLSSPVPKRQRILPYCHCLWEVLAVNSAINSVIGKNEARCLGCWSACPALLLLELKIIPDPWKWEMRNRGHLCTLYFGFYIGDIRGVPFVNISPAVRGPLSMQVFQQGLFTLKNQAN